MGHHRECFLQAFWWKAGEMSMKCVPKIWIQMIVIGSLTSIVNAAPSSTPATAAASVSTLVITSEMANQWLLEAATQIPRQLIELRIPRIGKLDLRQLITEFSRVQVEFKPWIASPVDAKNFRYFTSFEHTATSARVGVNAQFWFLLSPEARAALALNAFLSALGYNDDMYQMTTALWFFSRSESKQALSSGEYRYAMRLAEKICVRLPDVAPASPQSQSELRYSRITETSDNLPSFAGLKARSLTILAPVAPISGAGQAIVATEPVLPRMAAASGGGDWGGILMKQSMIRGNSEPTTPDPASPSKLLNDFRLTMVMGFEIGWESFQGKSLIAPGGSK